MSTVLVTGGAGFIGSHIVDMFCQQGDIVHIFDNLSSGSRDNVHPNATLHVVDICSPEARGLLETMKPDLLIHTAAQMSVRVSMIDPTFDATVNVVGLVNLLQPYLNGGEAPYVAFLSTGGAIYGEQEAFPASESHPLAPESVYGLAKQVGELYLDLWGRKAGLKWSALRLGNVYGPRQSPHGEAGVVAIFCDRLLAGQTPMINGDGAQTRDFVYVSDVARAVFLACTQRAIGRFNIGTGIENSVNSLYSILAKSIGHPDVAPEYGPAKGGEQLRSVIDAALAKKTFGWRPEESFQKGIEKTAAWFAERAKATPHSKNSGSEQNLQRHLGT